MAERGQMKIYICRGFLKKRHKENPCPAVAVLRADRSTKGGESWMRHRPLERMPRPKPGELSWRWNPGFSLHYGQSLASRLECAEILVKASGLGGQGSAFGGGDEEGAVARSRISGKEGGT